jgi:hypothetical protein
MSDAVVRSAEEHDLERIAVLTREHRGELARWAPQWWGKAAGADEIHPLWLRHLVADAATDVKVVEVDGHVVGCAAVFAQGSQWFVDDLVVDEEHWFRAGQALLHSIEQRPALTCCASNDGLRMKALARATLSRVSSYWVRATSPAGQLPAIEPITDAVDVPPPPLHTFGGPLDPSAEGALAFTLDGGVIVGSPSISAPPVYDPGGTVTVVDRVAGPDPGTLVDAASSLVADRGDVVLCVITSAGDGQLEMALDRRRFQRIADVFAWPQE